MMGTVSEPKSYELYFLDPATLRFSHAPEGTVRLEIVGQRCYLSVEVARSFPIDERGHYLSVRNALDEERREIGIIGDAAELDAASRLVVEEELYRRYFVPQILGISYLKEEFGVVNFSVETDRGPREFSVRHPHENLRQVGDHRLLIIDIDGCRYEVPDLEELDRKSVALLREYMDS